MKNLIKISAIICIFILNVSLLADTVYLKNGRAITGKIVGQSRKNVRIKTAGGIKVIPKTNIKRLRFGEIDNTNKKKEELKRKREEEKKRKEAELKNKQDEERRKRDEKKQTTEDAKGPSLWQAILRSSVLPGWGQYYQGRKNMGWIVGGSFFGSVAIAGYMDSRYRQDRIAYDENVNDFFLYSPLVLSSFGVSIPNTQPFLISGLFQTESTIAARQNMEDSARYANFMRTVVAAVYVWNIVDVVIYHPSENQTLRLKSKRDGLVLKYDIRF